MLRRASEHSIHAHQPARDPRWFLCALRWCEHVLATFGGIVLVSWLSFDYSAIVSPSMSPTLEGTSLDDGDRVLTEKLSGWFCTPRRWEVITFRDKSGERRMKRVVGLPGESVQMLADRELLIDGQRVEVPPVIDQKYLRYGKPVPCGDGYYVLGDDLKDSEDSRFNGPVPAERIIGRAWLIVWPKERAGWVR
ncbi:MAG: signal peptidase I [Pirellulales bacterium]|nr:signal peptidase I [Pirellulales bacterium]